MHFCTVSVSVALLATVSLVSAAPGLVKGNEAAVVELAPRGEGIYSGPVPTAPPGLAMKAPAKQAYDGQPFTIHIQNTAGDSMQMNLKHDADAPGAICCPHNGPLPSSTQVTYPTGWAGRISIGPIADENVITRGSTIEASFKNGIVQFDVSYVAGYTYPIVCSCQGQVVAGCNYPLLRHAAEDGGCPLPGNRICYNPNVDNQAIPRGSPAHPFFEPCQGAAWTYPNDFDANIHCPVNEISCCVGILCPRNPKQHKSKRDLEFEMFNGTLPVDFA
ncbi:hypothetical protein G7Y79_00036g072370 [Physcia stellaris]|nr:hypothetical protein G7Y79_00036g072370 [Physcia stellaris]